MHLTDGDVVRFMDSALNKDESRQAEQHIASCSACAQRLAVVRRQARVVKETLRLSDVRTHIRVNWGVRAAMVVFVLVGLSLTIQPVRAWIVDSARNLFAGGDADVPAAVGPPVANDAAIESPTGSVTFVPTAGRFVVSITSPQSSGLLRIVRSLDQTATATIIDGSGVEQFVVLPNGLRVVNAEGSQATYRLALPASVEQVRIQIGERRLEVEVPSAESPPTVISLDGRSEDEE